MAMKDWIKSAADKIREAIEQALPVPPRPERAPARIPVRIHVPRPARRYY